MQAGTSREIAQAMPLDTAREDDPDHRFKVTHETCHNRARSDGDGTWQHLRPTRASHSCHENVLDSLRLDSLRDRVEYHENDVPETV